jgi:hypothetical protein
MEQSHRSEADSSSVSQEIINSLWSKQLWFLSGKNHSAGTRVERNGTPVEYTCIKCDFAYPNDLDVHLL